MVNISNIFFSWERKNQEPTEYELYADDLKWKN